MFLNQYDASESDREAFEEEHAASGGVRTFTFTDPHSHHSLSSAHTTDQINQSSIINQSLQCSEWWRWRWCTLGIRLWFLVVLLSFSKTLWRTYSCRTANATQSTDTGLVVTHISTSITISHKHLLSLEELECVALHLVQCKFYKLKCNVLYMI